MHLFGASIKAPAMAASNTDNPNDSEWVTINMCALLYSRQAFLNDKPFLLYISNHGLFTSNVSTPPDINRLTIVLVLLDFTYLHTLVMISAIMK